MIASKSQSQATLPEQRSSPLASREKLAIASFYRNLSVQNRADVP